MSTSNNVNVTYEHLAVADSEAAKIAVVSLDRGDKLNGLTLEMLTELSAVARKLAADRDLRGVILRGEGKSFCAGLDFASAFKKPSRILRSFVPDIHGTNLFQRACWDWRRLPVPVIAAVHGHCYGGGLQIALGADFRITTGDAKWSILEAKWGLIPDMSGMRTILDEVSADTARWLTMSGEELNGKEATEIGLATWTVDTENAALELAKEKLAQLATRSPDQLAATKRLFRDVHRSPRSTFRAERTQQLLLLARKNTAIIRNAAMKKASPKFARRGTWTRG
ncbi:crotonase/enoyl-CoA hydratase family protein [Corynebacterium amycolatum]|uniref:crotonase/enoyl-CoA hydratase family protein n=1 Tax=Corynebacterium amycolatum TaxID=43765 RepID=UPI000185C0AE|nr:crotonase/enoyl-CoA hydratase family protein [Corynebacterium amycolatum]EEB63372.1 enoyl-CoA hydratase/isomerase family protein [Corynebacterium amycolatum SK46]